MPDWFDEKDINSFISAGAELTGGITGSILGYLAGDIQSAATGGMVGVMVKEAFYHTAHEIKSRLLGPRETMRLGAALTFALHKTSERLSRGDKIRQDSFFMDQPGERAAAKEILEGVLLAAQKEYQEKKIRHYGYLVANLAFEPNIDRAQANLLLKLGQDLTYRQLCLLSLFYFRDNYSLREKAYLSHNVNGLFFAILQEIYDLYFKGMLKSDLGSFVSITDIAPAKMTLQGTGMLLFELMGLKNIDKAEIDSIAKRLR